LLGEENRGADENKRGKPQVVSFMRTIRGILFHENDDRRLDMGEAECLPDEERHCEK